LAQKGYSVNEDALRIIEVCENWYKNKEIDDFHVRKNLNDKETKLARMNFAKRCCADDANLCEIVSVAPEKESQSADFINKLLEDNRFDVQYRKQLEKVSATGTAGAYILLKNAKYFEDAAGKITVKGGKIKINYVDADCIIPLTYENGLITECAFCSTNKVRGTEKTTLVIFLMGEDGRYAAETVVFDKEGSKIDNESNVIQLGEVKPFSIMTNSEVNNIDEMEGYGLPKIYNSIPLLKAVDLCYNLLYGDLSKGDKLVFINELLACIKTKEDGSPYLTPQQKELFILLGEKLPQADTLIKEYNPEIRVEQITKAFELVLSLLSMTFGYGTKKYTFENGKITTATEYIGTKQDCMQELNKQRKNAEDYISDIVHAAMWFSNTFQGTSYKVDEVLSTEFDDSYVEDKQTKLESMRADALSFPEVTILKMWYLMEKYNIPEEDAKKYIQNTEEPVDDLED
jgi:A118 family predicted phage portal protein